MCFPELHWVHPCLGKTMLRQFIGLFGASLNAFERICPSLPVSSTNQKDHLYQCRTIPWCWSAPDLTLQAASGAFCACAWGFVGRCPSSWLLCFSPSCCKQILFTVFFAPLLDVPVCLALRLQIHLWGSASILSFLWPSCFPCHLMPWSVLYSSSYMNLAISISPFRAGTSNCLVLEAAELHLIDVGTLVCFEHF